MSSIAWSQTARSFALSPARKSRRKQRGGVISRRLNSLFRFLSVAGLILLLSTCVVVNFQGLRSNPPGFFLDESSIAYNAATISQTGRDEYGVLWPVYFRA